MTVEQLLSNITVKELNEWRAFDLISPIGSKRIDINFAHLILMIMCMLNGNEKNLNIEDMMIDYEAPFLTEEEKKAREELKQQALYNRKQKNMINMDQVINMFKGWKKK